MKILVATHNLHKLRELQALFANLDIKWLTLKDLNDHNDPIENGKSYQENASIKARYYFDRYKMAVVADDSGLSVSCLNGLPGIHSKRYAKGSDHEKNEKLLLEIKDNPNRRAQFVCHLTFIDENGVIKHFKGYLKGIIIDKQKGKNGFGYDPIFQPNAYHKTLAELSFEEKNKISHRAKAYDKFKDYIHEIFNN